MSSARALSSSAALGSRWLPAPGERRPEASRHRGWRSRIEAKRSAKKRQGRKLEKREDVREMQRMMEKREAAAAAAAAYRPPPPPPPADPAAAAERIEERHRAYGEALERVGEAKASARESDRWDPTRGYKPFDEVQDAVRALALAKTAAYEAHLERAVALLCQAKGEPPASLDRFDWVYERGVEGDNARCLSFMLAALNKVNASTGMSEVLWVANECGLVPALDAKIVKAAVASLGELDDLGLLDEGEPETLAAVKEALNTGVSTNLERHSIQPSSRR